MVSIIVIFHFIFFIFVIYVYILFDFCYFCYVIMQWKFRCYNKEFLSLQIWPFSKSPICVRAVVAELLSFIFVYYFIKVELLQDYL